MKKNILLSAIAISLIVGCAILTSDGFTYLTIAVMALCIIGVFRANKSRMMKMTRWAKANPGKAQSLITVLQFVLIGLAIFTGKNLRELGFEFSNITAYVFAAILVIGFLSVPFMRTREKIVIPKELNRQRFGYLSIILSSLILTAIFGNRIQDFFPNSPLTQAIETFDQWVFPDDISEHINLNESPLGQTHREKYNQYAAGVSTGLALFVVNPVHDKNKVLSRKELKKLRKAERKAKRIERLRQLAVGGSCAAAVFFILLLIITTCAGICLVIGGVAGLSGGSSIALAILAIIAGPLITWGSVKGIIKVSKWCKKE